MSPYLFITISLLIFNLLMHPLTGISASSNGYWDNPYLLTTKGNPVKGTSPDQSQGALPILPIDGHSRDEIKSIIDAGAHYADELRADTALHLLTLGLQLAQDKRDVQLQGEAHLYLGMYYWRWDARHSLDHYHQSLKCFQASGDQHNEITAKNRIGYIHQKQGDYYKSLELFNAALKQANQTGDLIQQAETHRRLGLYYQYKKDYDLALGHLHQAIQIGKQVKDFGLVAEFYGEMGDLYRLMQDYPKAEDALNESQKYRIANGKDNWGFTILHLGLLYTDLKNLEKAEKYLSMAVDLFLQNEDQYGYAEALSTLGKVYHLKSDYGRARNTLTQALEVSMATNSHREILNTLQHLAQVEEVTGHLPDAIDYYKSYLSLKDSLSKLTSGESIGFMQAEYKFQQKEDSIRHASELKEANYEAKIQRQQKIQGVFTTSIMLLVILLIIVIFWIRSRNKAHGKLLELNRAIQGQHERLLEQRNQLQKTVRQLKKAQSQLLVSERKAAISVLAAGLGHEMNNPLNIVMGGLWRIKDFLKNGDITLSTMEKEDILRSLEDGVSRLKKIVKNLTHFDSPGAESIDEIEIHDIIEAAISRVYEPLNSKSIFLQRKFAKEPIHILCTYITVQRVFINLIQNSIDSIQTKGIIEIHTEVRDGNVQVTITDNGEGIKPEDYENIGEPFFTTKPAGQGFGLGLYISKNLAGANGGKVSLHPITNGAQAVILFPLSPTTQYQELVNVDY